MMAHEHIITTESYVQPEWKAVTDDWREKGLYSGSATPDLEKKEVDER